MVDKFVCKEVYSGLPKNLFATGLVASGFLQLAIVCICQLLTKNGEQSPQSKLLKFVDSSGKSKVVFKGEHFPFLDCPALLAV